MTTRSANANVPAALVGFAAMSLLNRSLDRAVEQSRPGCLGCSALDLGISGPPQSFDARQKEPEYKGASDVGNKGPHATVSTPKGNIHVGIDRDPQTQDLVATGVLKADERNSKFSDKEKKEAVEKVQDHLGTPAGEQKATGQAQAFKDGIGIGKGGWGAPTDPAMQAQIDRVAGGRRGANEDANDRPQADRRGENPGGRE